MTPYLVQKGTNFSRTCPPLMYTREDAGPKGVDLQFFYFPNCPLLALTSTVPFLVSTSPTIKAKVCISVVIRHNMFSLELNVTFLATLVSEFTYKSQFQTCVASRLASLFVLSRVWFSHIERKDLKRPMYCFLRFPKLEIDVSGQDPVCKTVMIFGILRSDFQLPWQLIAQLDDLCHSYLYFCVDHLVGGWDPIQRGVDCSDRC